MKTITKISVVLLGLLVVYAFVFPVIASRQERQRTHENQYKFLNARFDKIQFQNGKVIFTPNRTWGFPDQNRRRSFKPMIMSVGSTFEYHGHHWNWTYIIENIEPDGVVVNYHPSRPSIKLKWKP